MTGDDFSKMLVFWTLKGTVSEAVPLGKKIINGHAARNNQIIVNTKDFEVEILYTQFLESNEFEVIYADFNHKSTYTWEKFFGENAINKLAEI